MVSNWFVYMLECRDGSLYIGISNNVLKRLADHNAGKGSKYVRSKMPAKLLRAFAVVGKGEALKLEGRLKKLRREKKLWIAKSPEDEALEAINHLVGFGVSLWRGWEADGAAEGRGRVGAASAPASKAHAEAEATGAEAEAEAEAEATGRADDEWEAPPTNAALVDDE